MKVVMLNAGLGLRLRPLTINLPKALVKVAGKPIIAYQLDALLSQGLTDIVIVVGPFRTKIKRYVKSRYSDINATFIENPLYYSTNYIYSLWLTKGAVDDDVILLHGDVLFEPRLLRRMLTGEGNFVLVGRKNAGEPAKDFRAVVLRGRVLRIGIGYSGPLVRPCIPLYKFRREDFNLWLEKIGEHVTRGEVTIYTEEVLNELLEDLIYLRPIYFGRRDLCMEVDTLEDLKRAEELLRMRIQGT